MIERINKTGRLLVAKGKVEQADLPAPQSILNDSFLVGLRTEREHQAKLASEVAGTATQVKAPVIVAKEKEYTYAATEAKERPQADVGTLRLPNIYFPEGKATLDPNARSVVGGIADRLKSFPALCVRVYGYTNSSGNPQSNLKLSQQRASAIVTELAEVDKSAFPSTRFDARGFGSTVPVLRDGQEDLEASRRTEFKLFNCSGPVANSR
jgi:outer membrane protein OmpA-like peptidoglycan-associated protein